MKKCLLIAGIFLLGISLCVKSQSITIDSTFTSDGEIFPFSQVDSIYGLSLSGHVTLNSDTSLVRVILVDENYDEYMVYEAYPLIVTSMEFDITNVSDETKYMNDTDPYSIMVYLEDAELVLSAIIYQSGYTENTDSLQSDYKATIETTKVENINSYINSNNFTWGADTNSISTLSYSEKRNRFGEKYNLRGYDYYIAGIYTFLGPDEWNFTPSEYIDHFDWRERHSAHVNTTPYFEYKYPNQNNPKPYWDGDPDWHEVHPGEWDHEIGNGWLTKVKKQVRLCDNTCYLFGPVGAFEAIINLYYNQHFDANLSEQYIMSCDGLASSDCDGGSTGNTLEYLRDEGIMDQDYCPNQQNTNNNALDCSELDLYPPINYKFQSTGHFDSHLSLFDEIKHRLITYGPTQATVVGIPTTTMPHSMCLVGYKIVDKGDMVYRGPNLEPLVIDQDSPWMGALYWIFKDSNGMESYNPDNVNGYVSMFLNEINPDTPNYVLPWIQDVEPFYSAINQLEGDPLIREARDEDNDGYWNWNIGERPENCPNDYDLDSDDSNPRIGPFDNNYYSTPVAPQITVNVGSYEIKHGGFYSFSGDTTLINFIIKNAGNAQLNLKEEITGEGPIYIVGINSDSFNVYHEPANHIAMDGGQDTFAIQYIGEDWLTNIAEIRIALDEFDMEDFVFGLVHTEGNCPELDTIEVITGNEEWSGYQFKDHGVRVNDGGVLTITGNIGFVEDAYLNISRGGKVYIDSGTLTKACNYGLWKGINVSGNARESQGYEDEHGLLKIQNGGIIEYAEIAVETVNNDDTPDPDYYGGIIYANKAILRNNLVDVKLNPYRNTHPSTGAPYRNLSYFTNCYFLTTSELYDLLPGFMGQYLPENHLMLLGVDGIPVKGCFIENSDMNETDPDNRGNGIYAFNAGFEVTYSKPWLQGGDRLRSEFRTLNYGIKAMSGLISPPIRVDSCYFRDNSRGIYLSAIDYPELIYNEFLLKGDNTLYDETDTLAGIYLNDESVGYVVEENIFYNHEDYSPVSGRLHTVGIVANSTGQYPNEIYNNDFERMDFGILAMKDNRGYETGLQIKCNDFIYCESDIAVTPEDCDGIAAYQGSDANSPETSANNMFTWMGPQGTPTDFNNEGELLTYYFPQNGDEYHVEPKYYYNITPTTSLYIYNWNPDDGCPSHLDGSGSGGELRSEMTYFEQKADSTSTLLQQLEDGGNTDELNTDVQTSWPEEAYEIYSQLMADSPYLSDTVMVSGTQKENVLSGVMVTDILSANPQAAKSDTVMDAVNNRINQLTDEQLAEINQGLYMVGAKEALQS
ncbi:MAG: hypothetical protein K9G47_06805, partial [Bacteroidales bacterium]|nr:hypothetical protein [Bacteroidales bacterium]